MGKISDKYTIYKLFNGMVYKTRVGTSDLAILNETTIFKEYNIYDFNKLNKNSLVIDLGGHIGDFTIFTAYTKKSKVIVFEPEKENFLLLKDNIKLNSLEQKVQAVNKAVTNQNGYIDFYISDHNNTGVHSAHYQGPNKTKVETIDIKTIPQTYNIDKIDFLKIDIEGGEHELFKLANQSFFNLVQYLVLEYHCQNHVKNKQSLNKLKKEITNLGFNIFEIKGLPELGIIYAQKS